MTSSESCSDHFDGRLTKRHHPAPIHVSRSRAFLLLAGVFTYGMLGTTLPTPIYSLYQQQYNLTSFLITIIFTVYAVGVLVALLFFGRASDHFGRRPVVVAAMILAAISSLFFIFAVDVPMLLAGRFLSGLGSGLLTGTATAGLAEFEPADNPQRAARVAAAATLTGLGLGPLVSGLFAQLGPDPTRFVFIIYLVVLVFVTALAATLPETVEVRDHVLDLSPRVSVPSSTRVVFFQAALTLFCAYTLMGLFTSLASTFLEKTLRESNLIVDGGIVFLLFGVASLSQAALHSFTSRRARLSGLVTILLSLAIIEAGLGSVSISLFFIGTVAGGLGMGLALMGGLAAVNQVASPDQRGGMMSALYLVGYSGLTVPVVGVGILTDIIGLFLATVYLAVATTFLILVALAVLLRPRSETVKSTFSSAKDEIVISR